MAPLFDFTEVAISSLVYVTLSFSFYFYVRSKGPWTMVSPVMYFHNRIQITIALFLFTTTTMSLLPFAKTHYPIIDAMITRVKASDAALPRYAFHYSKFYEYLDMWLIILQGTGDLVSLHFSLHHLTTPWYTTLRVIRDYEGWEVFAWLNTFHHAFSEFHFSSMNYTHV